MRRDDDEALFSIYGDLEVMAYVSDSTFPDVATVHLMLDSVERLLAAGTSLEWAVVDAKTNQLAGTCGLHAFDRQSESADVGCVLARDHWGRGVMREALTELTRFATEALGLRGLLAEIDAPNERSVRLFRSLGFVRESATTYRKSLRSGAGADEMG